MARDMTEKQFRDALDRNGMFQRSLWIYKTDNPRSGVGIVMGAKGKHRRATLAHALKEFKRKK